MRFAATVEVQLRPGIADPEGATIDKAIAALGIAGVSEVRAGRCFRFTVEAEDLASAEEVADSLGERLLSNPVIERHLTTIEALG